VLIRQTARNAKASRSRMLVSPIAHVGQVIVERALEPARLVLRRPVGVHEGQHPVAARGRRQLDPHLDPYGFGGEVSGIGARHIRFPVRAVPGRQLLQGPRPVEGHVGIIRLGEGAFVEVVELRRGLPVLEDADDTELAAVPQDRLADAVPATEQPLVVLLTQHDHGLRALVRSRIPAAPVFEGHVEHREEVRRRGAGHDGHRRLLAGSAVQHAQELGHHRLVPRDVRAHEIGSVPVGELERGQGRMVRVRRLSGVPGIHGHRIQHTALPPDRIAGHRVVDGERHDAGADAERDGADHQRGESGRAPEALRGEAQVIRDHARASSVGRRRS